MSSKSFREKKKKKNTDKDHFPRESHCGLSEDKKAFSSVTRRVMGSWCSAGIKGDGVGDFE